MVHLQEVLLWRDLSFVVDEGEILLWLQGWLTDTTDGIGADESSTSAAGTSSESQLEN